MNIKERIGLRSPVVFKSSYGESPAVVPNLIFGLELEIEEWDPDAIREFDGFGFTDDGSLRGNDNGIGIEAITLPVKAKHLPGLLRAFFDNYEVGPHNYTERCSTHVHMNVQDITCEQLASLCLLYQTVEELLFAFVGHDRDEGVFCVPWNQSGISYSIVERLEGFSKGTKNPLRQWQKYSALNLIPIGSQGSIEFRHLEGTCDVERIMQWVNILSRMYLYAVNTPLNVVSQEIMGMNTVSNYREWLDRVFEREADLLRTPGFERVLASGVIDSKLALLKEKEQSGFTYINPIENLNALLDRMNRAIPPIEITPPPEGSF